MKAALLLSLAALMSVSAFARNDFWLGSRYSVALSFGASDLGKKNAPIPKSVPLPEYPAEMIPAAINGEVVVDYSVQPDGSISESKIVQASAEGFRVAVAAAMKTWRFAPAVDLSTGKPVAARMRCKLRFSITDEEEPYQLQPTSGS